MPPEYSLSVLINCKLVFTPFWTINFHPYFLEEHFVFRSKLFCAVCYVKWSFNALISKIIENIFEVDNFRAICLKIFFVSTFNELKIMVVTIIFNFLFLIKYMNLEWEESFVMMGNPNTTKNDPLISSHRLKESAILLQSKIIFICFTAIGWRVSWRQSLTSLWGNSWKWQWTLKLYH